MRGLGTGSSSPHQSAGWNLRHHQSKIRGLFRHALDSGVKPDFHAASREHLLRVSS